MSDEELADIIVEIGNDYIAVKDVSDPPGGMLSYYKDPRLALGEANVTIDDHRETEEDG